MGVYHATNLITEAFDKEGIKYEVRYMENCRLEEVKAGFAIHGGPEVIVRFISTDDSNDVGVRVISLLNNIAGEKRSRIMEACNYMNTQKRFLCFMVDHDGDVNVSYDFPQRTDDSCLGSAAVEIFIRIMQILHDAFPVLMKALYTDEAITDEQPSGRRGTITADPDQEGAEPEEDAEDETGSEGDRYPVRLQKMLMDRLSDDADDPSSAND